MDLKPRPKTEVKRKQVAQYLLYSVVGAPLAGVPLGAIAPATIHVMLGLTKNVRLVIEVMHEARGAGGRKN